MPDTSMCLGGSAGGTVKVPVSRRFYPDERMGTLVVTEQVNGQYAGEVRFHVSKAADLDALIREATALQNEMAAAQGLCTRCSKPREYADRSICGSCADDIRMEEEGEKAMLEQEMAHLTPGEAF